MTGRVFHGVDLDKNYGSLMLKAENPERKRHYALLRQFRGYCLRLEREVRKEMIVLGNDGRIYMVIDIKGWGIEEKEYWLQRLTSSVMTKKEATDIYPLEWWIDERDRLREGVERRPMWFKVVDAIKKMEVQQ